MRESVENINNFLFVATIPPVLHSRSATVIEGTARGAYVKVLEVLRAAGFHHENLLELRIVERGFEIRYNDADLGFTLTLIDNHIRLRRDGCSLDRFEYWYRQFMPSVGSLVESVLNELADASEWQEVRVLRVQCQFYIIAYDFRDDDAAETEEPLKNAELLSDVISSVPHADGHLVGPSDVMEALGRIDYTVSRWSQLSNGQWVREVYDIECPGNRNYTGIWLTYTVIGETFEGGDGSREPFDFDRFIANNGMDIYDDLFTAKFLNGLFPDLFRSRTFKTTAGSLP